MSRDNSTATPTVIWTGPGGLEVRKRDLRASFENPPDPAFIWMMLVVVDAAGACTQFIAYGRSVTQVAKIERNPERWARGIFYQRLRTARARVLRCLRLRDDAQAEGDRWAALAEQLGILR